MGERKLNESVFQPQLRLFFVLNKNYCNNSLFSNIHEGAEGLGSMEGHLLIQCSCCGASQDKNVVKLRLHIIDTKKCMILHLNL